MDGLKILRVKTEFFLFPSLCSIPILDKAARIKQNDDSQILAAVTDNPPCFAIKKVKVDAPGDNFDPRTDRKIGKSELGEIVAD